MFRIDDLSHIVIVGGDSDYVALAQKCKRLGRYVVGIGVAGGTSRALTASCDEYADYDALLSTDAAVEADEAAIEPAEAPAAPPKSRRATRGGGRAKTTDVPADAAPDGTAESTEAETEPAPVKASRRSPAPVIFSDGTEAPTGTTRNPSRLLLKALELLRAKNDEEWQPSGAVKNQMQRMDPGFQERRLGFGSFTEFVKSRGGVVELDETQPNRIRIRPSKD
jgi:hypothetical protein